VRVLNVFLGIVFLWTGVVGATCPPKKDDKVLYVYGWSGSMDASILKAFEKETGIRVIYDTYESNDILEAKLLTGKAKFDLVMPSVSPNFIRQIRMQAFQPVQKSKIPNYKNLDPRILQLIEQFDNDNTYGIPYTMGTMGFGFNKKIIKDLPASLSVLFDEESLKKYQACGILMLDSPQDVLESALVFLGNSPDCREPLKLQEAFQIIEKVTPYIKDFTANTDRVVRELSRGESCLVQLWSSDALLAQRHMNDQGSSLEMGYVVPKEWPGLWIDMLCIPKNALHPDYAHQFINFILRPDIAAQIVQKNFLAVPNTKMKRFLPKNLQENPMIFIPEHALKSLRIQAPLSFKDERKVMRQWMHLKLGW
jgi:putrescine transport system substrate-binding protein